MTENIVLVDESGKAIGSEEKMKVHRLGLLHNAFSIFIFNSENQLLLQKRDKKKYHSPGLWSNSVCGHQKEGEKIIESANRRLWEEMRIKCDIKEICFLTYKYKLPNGLTENEYDHIFIGRYDGKVTPTPGEVEDFKWIHISNIKKDIEKNPEKYTVWFRKIVEEYEDFLVFE
jgi:isopentenyl-diphosphate delta-isomerase